MAFGGTVKLVGESEYRQALQRCTQSLQGMSSALKAQTASFSSNDKSIKDTATRQKELTDAIKKQETELSKAKSQYAQYSVTVQAQTVKHNALNKEYKAAVTQLEQIKRASGTSSTVYQQFSAKVDELGKELADSTEELNESKRAMSNLKSEINSSSKVIDNAKKEIDGLGKETKETGEEARNAGDGFTVFKGVLANLTTQGINAAINGMKKLGTSFINVGKEAISGYAQFEQLEGGIQKLFGAGGQSVEEYAKSVGKSISEVQGEYNNLMKGQQAVMDNASKGFQTAGMSANEYLDTVTSFSASLISGLDGDTVEAARIADMAIRDMSDNANTFGTDISMIQNAYQGFAKGNFTMLDNLKLGYGGTQSEMARLINESGVLGDSIQVTAESVKNVPFDKMIEAINKTQERMGIMGTTSREASYTIEGSTNSMKAAWQNMLTGMADENANFEQLATNFIGTLITEDGKGGVLGQLVPRITTVIQGMSNAIATTLPQVIQSVIPLIEQNLPLIITAVEQAIQTIVSVLPTIIDAIAPLIPQIVTMLISMLPQIIEAGVQILLSLVDGITKALPDLIKMLPKIIKDICTTLLDNLGLIIDAGIELIMALVDGLIEALPELIDYIPEIIDKVIVAITENLPKLIEAGITLIVKLAEGLIKAIPQLVSKIPQIISSIVKGIGTYYKNLFSVGKDLLLKLRDGIMNNLSELASKVKEIPGKLKEWLISGISKIKDAGKELISGMWNGIKEKWEGLKNKVKEFGEGIVGKFKSVFGIKSPSKVFKEQIGENLALGISEGFENEMKNVTRDMTNAIPTNFDTTISTGVNGSNGSIISNTYYDIVAAFKEALGDMKIELDDENMGKFIDKTVAKTIYS